MVRNKHSKQLEINKFVDYDDNTNSNESSYCQRKKWFPD